MDTPSESKVLPLDEVMLAMDVVDTLRHRQDLAVNELDAADHQAQLLTRLRDIYHEQGIEVPDHILKEGVAALAESRFVYTPVTGGPGVTLARLYVSRKVWGRWAAGIVLAIVLIVSGYWFGYVPYQAAQVEAAHIELTKTLPERMDRLYTTIYEETKVQIAVTKAEALRARGKSDAAAGNRAGADAAVAALEALRNQLQQDYTLKIVNHDGIKSGFWTFPDINTDATNYYIVVEAIDTTSGKPLDLPILNEETGQTETVSLWGLRVPESVYRSVEADKRDDGIIERDVVGVKQFGFLDVDYVVPVLGGAVTRW